MNKLMLTITLTLLLVFPVAEAKGRHHHIKRFKVISVKLLPPPPPSELPVMKAETTLSFKETCAMIALDHTLDDTEDKQKAITDAWDIAEHMEQQRIEHNEPKSKQSSP